MGIASLGGMGTTIDYVEKLLKDCGALKNVTAHGDDEDAEDQRRGFRISRATKQDDSDDDCD